MDILFSLLLPARDVLPNDYSRRQRMVRTFRCELFGLTVACYARAIIASRRPVPSPQRDEEESGRRTNDTRLTRFHLSPPLKRSITPDQRPQNRLAAGSGVGLLLALRSSRPRCLNHFLVARSNSRSSSALGSFRWMKLQKPPRTQPSPLFNRQQASRKSVTGDNSQ